MPLEANRLLAELVQRITVRTPGQGLHEITDRVRAVARESGVSEGLCTVMIQHTSASLTIQENADPSARRDLEAWLSRLVKENDPLYTHTAEGPDDMPAHIKAALTATTLSLPTADGALARGTWPGLYVRAHRRPGGPRREPRLRAAGLRAGPVPRRLVQLRPGRRRGRRCRPWQPVGDRVGSRHRRVERVGLLAGVRRSAWRPLPHHGPRHAPGIRPDRRRGECDRQRRVA